MTSVDGYTELSAAYTGDVASVNTFFTFSSLTYGVLLITLILTVIFVIPLASPNAPAPVRSLTLSVISTGAPAVVR